MLTAKYNYRRKKPYFICSRVGRLIRYDGVDYKTITLLSERKASQVTLRKSKMCFRQALPLSLRRCLAGRI